MIVKNYKKLLTNLINFSVEKYLILLLPLLFITSGHGWGGDFALYIDQSFHLINGNLDELYTHNYNLSQYKRLGPYFYPMGVPILISPVLSVFGLNFIALKLYAFLFWIGSIIFLKKTLTNISSSKETVNLTVFFVSISYIYISHVNYILSDIYFFFFFNLWAFVITSKKKNQIRYLLFNGLLLFMLVIIRPTGIILVLSYLLFLIASFFLKKKHLTRFIPIVICCLLFLLYNRVFDFDFGSNEQEYILSNIDLNSILSNLRHYLVLLTSYFTDPIYYILTFLKVNDTYKTPLLFLFIGTIIYILKEVIRKQKIKNLVTNESTSLLIISCLSILSLYIILPMQNGIRFLFPIIPFLVFIFFTSIKNEFYRYTLVSLKIAFLFLMLFPGNIKLPEKNIETLNSLTAETTEVYDYIKAHLKISDTISFFKPRVLRLYTNRTCLPETKESLNDSRFYLKHNQLSKDINVDENKYSKLIENKTLTLYKKLN
tara:strand:+ start:19186 stop:20646 length:1461 start_codon:yes stop_codon:yes gene_type:complete